MPGSQRLNLFIGGVRRDYCITHDNRVILNALGGNAVYSAVGARIWDTNAHILSRVGGEFPTEFLERLEEEGIRTGGIKRIPGANGDITFYCYTSPEARVDTNPAAHFLRLGLPLPKELLDYQSSTGGQANREEFGPLAVRASDMEEIEGAFQSAHLAPADYLTHSTLPYHLRIRGANFISLDPSERYMQPGFRDDLPRLLNGIDAFLPSEREASHFYQPSPPDLWTAAESFSGMGPPFVIIKRGAAGQFLWDRESSSRWHIPAYNARVKDVTGAGDAFCGGFLAGFQETSDPVESALRGSVSASLVIEGTGALYALASAPGLALSRLHALRSMVRKI